MQRAPDPFGDGLVAPLGCGGDRLQVICPEPHGDDPAFGFAAGELRPAHLLWLSWPWHGLCTPAQWPP
jgi:hypothetical protein